MTYVAWMKDQTAVELGIFTEDREENKQIFDRMYGKKAEIEKAFGAELSWDRLTDENRGSRIRRVIREGGLVDQVKWPAMQDAMIDAMDKLAKALKPHLAAAVAAA